MPLRHGKSQRPIKVTFSIEALRVLINPGLVALRPGVTAKPEIIAILGRGQSFGEIALVDEGVRKASIRAAGKETLLLKISRGRLLLLCNNYPELGYKVMYNLAIDLANKIRNTDLRIPARHYSTNGVAQENRTEPNSFLVTLIK